MSKLLKIALAASAALSLASVAHANGLNEDGAWQFQSAAQTQVMQSNLVLMEARRLGNNGSATSAVGSGLASALAVGTYNQFIDNSTTINQCTAATGGPVTCSATRGSNSSAATQTNSQSPSTATNNVTGNKINGGSN